MKVIAKILTLAGSLMLLAGCASQPNAFANADPAADFSQYQTYAYFDTLSTDKQQYQSMESNFLKVAVAQEFDKRGLVYDPANPQLRVNFYINTEEKIKSRSVPTMGGYYSYRDPFYDPWMGYGGVGGGYETRIDQYTEGTLSIDVVDTATKKLIWEGSVFGRITKKDVQNLEKTIDEAVAAVMRGFPVQAPGKK